MGGWDVRRSRGEDARGWIGWAFCWDWLFMKMVGIVELDLTMALIQSVLAASRFVDA